MIGKLLLRPLVWNNLTDLAHGKFTGGGQSHVEGNNWGSCDYVRENRFIYVMLMNE